MSVTLARIHLEAKGECLHGKPGRIIYFVISPISQGVYDGIAP